MANPENLLPEHGRKTSLGRYINKLARNWYEGGDVESSAENVITAYDSLRDLVGQEKANAIMEKLLRRARLRWE